MHWSKLNLRSILRLWAALGVVSLSGVAIQAGSLPYWYSPQAAHIGNCESYGYFPTAWRAWPISPPPVVTVLPTPAALPAPGAVPAPKKAPAEPPKKTQGPGESGPTADFRILPSR